MDAVNLINHENDYKLFSGQPLFAGLCHNQTQLLFEKSREEVLQPNDFLVREGEDAAALFVIVSGECVVKKGDAQTNRQHTIASLGAGQVVGEMGLFDEKKRAATVECVKPTVVRKIFYADFFELAQGDPSFYKTFLNLSKNLSNRVRSNNAQTIAALQKNLDESHKREQMGKFLVGIVVFLCFFSFGLSSLSSISKYAPSTTVTTFLLLGLSFIYMCVAIKVLQVPWSEFGLNLRNGFKSIVESLLFSVPLLLVVVVIKLALTAFVTGYEQRLVFDLWFQVKPSVFLGYSLSPWQVWSASLLLYSAIGCVFQELLCRGFLQSVLTSFFTGKYRAVISIFLSNFIFATMHLHIGVYIPILVFVPGLLFGWLYHRHGNLIGCSVAHVLVGVWGLFIVGLK